MIALPIISVVCCFAYIFYIIIKYGVPVSLSETYYLLQNKQDWLFSAWCVFTSVPLGVYWFLSANEMKWIPVITMLCLLLVAVSSRYKSLCKCDEHCILEDTEKPIVQLGLKGKLQEMFSMFTKAFISKFGIAKMIHYIASIIAIILSTVYICVLNKYAIYSTALLYPIFIIIGLKIKGIYNEKMSLDVNNSIWIFLMEVICFINLFIFIW